ncbi:hypothetical protein MRBLWH7_001866 [Microbacterium sp. LWH7-1.2]|uniref:hypothetical protein n=1 Tax=Microbacterium sp. LWH7-1.2 TaxID=3135257 RepID=UPI00313A420B
MDAFPLLIIIGLVLFIGAALFVDRWRKSDKITAEKRRIINLWFSALLTIGITALILITIWIVISVTVAR